MSKDTIIEFKTPAAERTDPLTDLLRTGAQQLIANAVEAELLELLGQYADSKDEQGRQVIVRNGYLPAREIQTGIGPVRVKEVVQTVSPERALKRLSTHQAPTYLVRRRTSRHGTLRD